MIEETGHKHCLATPGSGIEPLGFRRSRTPSGREARTGENPGCESAAKCSCEVSCEVSGEGFGEASVRDGATGCCGGARSRRKVKRRTGDDWMTRDASGFESGPPRAARRGFEMGISLFSEHRGGRGMADTSWRSQLTGSNRCS